MVNREQDARLGLRPAAPWFALTSSQLFRRFGFPRRRRRTEGASRAAYRGEKRLWVL